MYASATAKKTNSSQRPESPGSQQVPQRDAISALGSFELGAIALSPDQQSGYEAQADALRPPQRSGDSRTNGSVRGSTSRKQSNEKDRSQSSSTRIMKFKRQQAYAYIKLVLRDITEQARNTISVVNETVVGDVKALHFHSGCRNVFARVVELENAPVELVTKQQWQGLTPWITTAAYHVHYLSKFGNEQAIPETNVGFDLQLEALESLMMTAKSVGYTVPSKARALKTSRRFGKQAKLNRRERRRLKRYSAQAKEVYGEGRWKTIDAYTADMVVRSAVDVVKRHFGRTIGDGTGAFDDALLMMWAAVGDRTHTYSQYSGLPSTVPGKRISTKYTKELESVDISERDSRRLSMYQTAIKKLRPAIRRAEMKDDTEWTRSQIQTQFWKRSHVHEGRLRKLAREERTKAGVKRVENAVRVDGGVVELPGKLTKKNLGKAKKDLRKIIKKQISTVSLLNDQIGNLADAANGKSVDDVAKKLLAGKEIKFGRQKVSWGPGALGIIQKHLGLVDGMLELTDSELAKKMQDPKNPFQGMTSTIDFGKAVMAIPVGLVSFTAALAGGIAKATGQAVMARQAFGLAMSVGSAAGNVLAGVEIVHGILVLMDSSASSADKDNAIRGIMIGSATLTAKVIGASGGIAAFAAFLTYYKLKLGAHLYWKTRRNLTSGIHAAFKTMGRSYEKMARARENVLKASLLKSQETDPYKRETLARAEQALVHELRVAIWAFWGSLKRPSGYHPSVAGYWTTLRKVFAPLMPLQKKLSSKSVSVAVKVADRMMKKAVWCLAHKEELHNRAASER